MADKYKVLGSKTIFDSLVKARSEAYYSCLKNQVDKMHVYIYDKSSTFEWRAIGEVSVVFHPKYTTPYLFWTTWEGPNKYPVSKIMTSDGKLK